MKTTIKLLACCFILPTLTLLACAIQHSNTEISSDGVTISYSAQGEGKPAILFVHGWSNNRSIWDDQVAHFSNQYRVVTVDLAGFGESGSNRQAWTMSSFGEDVKAVIEKLGLDQVILVGFSMGGPVVIETAKKLPKPVVGIVIVDGFQNVEMKFPPEVISHMDSVFMDLVTNPTLEKSAYFFVNNREESLQRVIAMIKDSPKIGWQESIVEYFRWKNDDCTGSLAEMNSPIIAINSDQEITKADVFRKYAPNFKAKIIPDVGHVVMWDAPDTFNSLLAESIQDFIRE